MNGTLKGWPEGAVASCRLLMRLPLPTLPTDGKQFVLEEEVKVSIVRQLGRRKARELAREHWHTGARRLIVPRQPAFDRFDRTFVRRHSTAPAISGVRLPTNSNTMLAAAQRADGELLDTCVPRAAAITVAVPERARRGAA